MGGDRVPVRDRRSCRRRGSERPKTWRWFPELARSGRTLGESQRLRQGLGRGGDGHALTVPVPVRSESMRLTVTGDAQV